MTLVLIQTLVIITTNVGVELLDDGQEGAVIRWFGAMFLAIIIAMLWIEFFHGFDRHWQQQQRQNAPRGNVTVEVRREETSSKQRAGG